MLETRLINHNLVSTNVSITFSKEDELGKTKKFSKTLSDVKETASYEDIYAAASAIAKLYDYETFDVKLISTHLIENNDTANTLEENENHISTLEELINDDDTATTLEENY